MRLRAVPLSIVLLSTFLVGFKLLEVQSGPSGTPNRRCADCHDEIFSEWRTSAHARSYTSPRFRERSASYSRKDCLPCHVPVTAQVTPLTTRTWSQESGVDCVSCHVLDDVVRGPYDTEAGHTSIEDRRFLDSRACQQCHGNSVLEGRLAPAALASRTCQSCHMPVEVRYLADGIYTLFRKEKRSGDHGFDLSSLMRSAARLEWVYDEATRTLAVTATNVGAAHNLPTGTHGAPTVRLILYLEEDAPSGPVTKRVMAFSNRDGTAIVPGGSATLEVPVRRDVPLRFSAHVRLLFFAHDDVPEIRAAVMASRDFSFDYEPPARE